MPDLLTPQALATGTLLTCSERPLSVYGFTVTVLRSVKELLETLGVICSPSQLALWSSRLSSGTSSHRKEVSDRVKREMTICYMMRLL